MNWTLELESVGGDYVHYYKLNFSKSIMLQEFLESLKHDKDANRFGASIEINDIIDTYNLDYNNGKYSKSLPDKLKYCVIDSATASGYGYLCYSLNI